MSLIVEYCMISVPECVRNHWFIEYKKYTIRDEPMEEDFKMARRNPVVFAICLSIGMNVMRSYGETNIDEVTYIPFVLRAHWISIGDSDDISMSDFRISNGFLLSFSHVYTVCLSQTGSSQFQLFLRGGDIY